MTRFEIEHRTVHDYAEPVSESVGQLRLRPLARPNQRLRRHAVRVIPETECFAYEDYFGNAVEAFSVPFRHDRLEVVARSVVDVTAPEVADIIMEVPVAEARQIARSVRSTQMDFVHPSPLVGVDGPFLLYTRRFFRGAIPVGEALRALNGYIHRRFRYVAGTTRVDTPAEEVARRRRGVCQDFAHFMLGVLRTAGFPARYVSGYIETAQAKAASEEGRPDLIGSAATHAWVEVFLPGAVWVALDPTNGIFVGDRHVAIAVGRDYQDVAPLRGTYRGPKSRSPEVRVRMRRRVAKEA